MKIHRLLLALPALVLTACLTAPSPRPTFALLTDPAAAARATKVTRDDFKKMTQYRGANASEYKLLYLRAWKKDGGTDVEYQIYLTSFYGDQWRFYSEAFDSNGNKLNFLSIDRKVDSCSGARGCYYEETVGLNVTRKYLEENQEAGIRYKISGKAGEEVGFLPAAYVKGFLLSVDALPATVSTSAQMKGPDVWWQFPK